jgi:multiple sugar transport system permease protein
VEEVQMSGNEPAEGSVRARRLDLRLANRIERLSDNTFAYLMLTPAFVLLGSMAVWPLFETFKVSLFANSSTAYVGAFVAVENYVEILTGQRDFMLTRPFFDLSKPFTSALPVTIIITVVSVLVASVVGVAQAVVLDKEFLGRDIARVLIILPWTFPVVIYGMVFFLFFQPGFGYGVDLFEIVGLSGAPLADSVESTLVLTIAYAWRGAPFIALLVLAGIQSIDGSLYDVAAVMGASKWQQFRRITFPLALPSLLVGALFTTIAGMKMFGLVVTVTGSCGSVTTISCLVYLSFTQQRYGSAAALGFITAVIIGVMTIVYVVKLRDNTEL